MSSINCSNVKSIIYSKLPIMYNKLCTSRTKNTKCWERIHYFCRNRPPFYLNFRIRALFQFLDDKLRLRRKCTFCHAYFLNYVILLLFVIFLCYSCIVTIMLHIHVSWLFRLTFSDSWKWDLKNPFSDLRVLNWYSQSMNLENVITVNMEWVLSGQMMVFWRSHFL